MLTTAGGFAIAFAMTGCAPAAKTTDAAAPPAATAVATQATGTNSNAAGTQAAPAPRPMGKRAAPRPGERISPVIAARGGGRGWDIQISNTDGYDHDVVLSWNDGRKHGQGHAVYQPAVDGATARIELRGTLAAQGGGKAMTIELREQACSGDDGIAHLHGITVSVSGMPPLRGCADLAI
ncbi:MAG: hypothetical protein M3R16_08380 [Pseudomonadota bacterium]|nr:hypothetical protein [Pseudomonadota bacterium]